MCWDKRRSTRPRSVRGFSLLEALGATALVGGALLGLAMGAINVSQNSKSADATAAATGLATEKLEQLRSMPLDAAAFVPGIYYDNANPMKADGTSGGSGAIYRRRWNVSLKDTPRFGVKTVTVTVAWKDSRPHETSLAAYVRCSTIPCK
jgi:Tfp pilus assembly protein PilV